MLHWIDLAIIGAYVTYSIASGFIGTKGAGANLEEYFLAGRSLRGYEAGLSMAATQFAADTPLVVTGLLASAGVFSLWRMWIYAVAFLFMAIVLGASWRRSGVITDAALTEVRYGGKPAAALRGVKAIYFGFVFNCTVLGMVLLATTRITEPFLTWHEWLPAGVFGPVVAFIETLGFPLTASGAPCIEGACSAGACIEQRCIGAAEWAASADNAISIGVIVLVTTLYSTTGGLRAVVKTDMVQFAIAIVSTVVFAWVVVDRVGGFGALGERLREIYPADGSGPNGMTASELLAFTPGEAHDIGLTAIAVIAIQWLCQINADGSGYLAQRTMACRSDRDARNAGIIFTVTQILVRSLVWLPIGVGLLVLFPPEGGFSGAAFESTREATFVRGIAEHLPAGVKGLMITGMLGALASTVDTHLNWGSSYFTNDLFKRFIAPRISDKEPSPRALVWIARVANFVILGLALLVMPLMGSIQTAWKASLLLGAGVGVLLVLRWLWWRMNATGELAALVGSAAYAPVLLWLVDDDGIRLLAMAALATGTGIAAALLTRPEDPERLREFYLRVRPPGFWGPFADEGASDAKRRLGYSLTATAGAALSIFCLLTGIGSAMLGSPAPSFVPSESVWIALNVVLGVGTIPVWLWLLRRSRAPSKPATTPSEPEL